MLWDLSLNEWLMSFAFISCYAFITGWVCDRILLSAGFGAIGNWLLLLLGAYAGLFGLNMYGYEFDWYPTITISAILGSTAGVFISMCIIKRVFYL